VVVSLDLVPLLLSVSQPRVVVVQVVVECVSCVRS
jgi:hypothetical protein